MKHRCGVATTCPASCRRDTITRYQADQFVEPQAQVVYDKLRKPKELTTFTIAQGADFHCAPMAPQYRNEVVFDWLAQYLGESETPVRADRVG